MNDGSPAVVRPPRDQLAYAGMNAEFAVGAVGLPPLNCQWQRNGTNLPGATSSTLVLTNVQVADAGSYRVVVSNALGTAVSAVATLTVTTSPPIILGQPLDQVAGVGAEAAFTVSFRGLKPPTFRGSKTTHPRDLVFITLCAFRSRTFASR